MSIAMYPAWPVAWLENSALFDFVNTCEAQPILLESQREGHSPLCAMNTLRNSTAFQFYFERRLAKFEKDGAGKRTTEAYFLCCIGSRN